MRILPLVGLLCLTLGCATAAVPAPGSLCPSSFALTTPDNLQHPEIFTPNLFLYNINELMEGDPDGPWFKADPNACSWNPNTGAFSCNILLYKSILRRPIDAIGSGQLTGSFTASGGYIGGCITVSTTFTQTITLPGYDETKLRNWRPQSGTRVCYRHRDEMADMAPGVANTISTVNGQQYITLWGSNGYVDAADDWPVASDRGVAIDLRFAIACPTNPPPIIAPNCPCNTVFTVPNYCPGAASNSADYTASGNCASLTFTQSIACPP